MENTRWTSSTYFIFSCFVYHHRERHYFFFFTVFSTLFLYFIRGWTSGAGKRKMKQYLFHSRCLSQQNSLKRGIIIFQCFLILLTLLSFTHNFTMRKELAVIFFMMTRVERYYYFSLFLYLEPHQLSLLGWKYKKQQYFSFIIFLRTL